MPQDKLPTLNGTPTKVKELNIGSDAVEDQPVTGLLARFKRAFRNLSLFMAGMYTGVGCSGTPHSHQLSNDPSDQEGTGKPRRSGPV